MNRVQLSCSSVRGPGASDECGGMAAVGAIEGVVRGIEGEDGGTVGEDIGDGDAGKHVAGEDPEEGHIATAFGSLRKMDSMFHLVAGRFVGGRRDGNAIGMPAGGIDDGGPSTPKLKGVVMLHFICPDLDASHAVVRHGLVGVLNLVGALAGRKRIHYRIAYADSSNVSRGLSGPCSPECNCDSDR